MSPELDPIDEMLDELLEQKKQMRAGQKSFKSAAEKIINKHLEDVV
tara:strand:- start:2855 stop:2992 length:138 start_codon:yes stop_codon:yes gene_type:complete